jgi:hypothetical protein
MHADPPQSCPQPPQLTVSVCGYTQNPLHTVPAQVQVPDAQSGAGCMQPGWLSQVPVESQVCGVVPTHCFVFGAQLPEHVPAPVQRKGHVVPEPHAPVLSHVCTLAPEHWVAPGTQLPVQAPFEQPNWHDWLVCHLPVASHVCEPPPAHCLAPGAQAPLQAPPLQMKGHLEMVVHCPTGEHAWTFLPLQR